MDRRTEVISDDEESEDDTDESEAIADVLNEFFEGDKTLDEDDVNQILADCIEARRGEDPSCGQRGIHIRRPGGRRPPALEIVMSNVKSLSPSAASQPGAWGTRRPAGWRALQRRIWAGLFRTSRRLVGFSRLGGFQNWPGFEGWLVSS